jgi:hypothetical protein
MEGAAAATSSGILPYLQQERVLRWMRQLLGLRYQVFLDSSNNNGEYTYLAKRAHGSGSTVDPYRLRQTRSLLRLTHHSAASNRLFPPDVNNSRQRYEMWFVMNIRSTTNHISYRCLELLTSGGNNLLKASNLAPLSRLDSAISFEVSQNNFTNL